MKLSELIEQAQFLLNKHGDLNVEIYTKRFDGIYDGFYPLKLIYKKSNAYEKEMIEAKSTVEY
jgi:hypothetical protein